MRPAAKTAGQILRRTINSMKARSTFPSQRGETICGLTINAPLSLAARYDNAATRHTRITKRCGGYRFAALQERRLRSVGLPPMLQDRLARRVAMQLLGPVQTIPPFYTLMLQSRK